MMKVKEFFEENKEMIFLVMLIGAACGALHDAGRKSGMKYVFDKYCTIDKNTALYRTLLSIDNKYHGNYIAVHSNGCVEVGPEELGKLGKAMLDSAEKNHVKVGKFTHFIAFGPYEK